MDVEYIDNEYRLCIDDTRSELTNNKEKIYYAGSFQNIKTQTILNDKQIMVYLEDLLGTTIPLIIYQ